MSQVPSNVEQFLGSLTTANQGIGIASQNLQAELAASTQRSIAQGRNITAITVQDKKNKSFEAFNLAKSKLADKEIAARERAAESARIFADNEQSERFQHDEDQQQARFLNEEANIKHMEEVSLAHEQVNRELLIAEKEAVLGAIEEGFNSDQQQHIKDLRDQRDQLDLALVAFQYGEVLGQALRPRLAVEMMEATSQFVVGRKTLFDTAVTLATGGVNEWIVDEISKKTPYLFGVAKRAIGAREGGVGRAILDPNLQFAQMAGIWAEDIGRSLLNWFLPDHLQVTGSSEKNWPPVIRHSAYVINKMGEQIALQFAAQAKGSPEKLRAAVIDFLGTGLMASRAFGDSSQFGDSDDKMEEFENAAVDLRNYLNDEQIQGIMTVVENVAATFENGEAVKAAGLRMGNDAKELLKGTGRDFERMGSVFNIMRTTPKTRFSGFSVGLDVASVLPAMIAAAAEASTSPDELRRTLLDQYGMSPDEALEILEIYKRTLDVGTTKQGEARSLELERKKQKLDRLTEAAVRKRDRDITKSGLERQLEALKEVPVVTRPR